MKSFSLFLFSIHISRYLDNNSITIITEYTFMNLNNVHVLSLSHNDIETIAEEAFHNLSELRELNICHNKIVRLNPAIFINQDRLKRLCLGNNPVVFIPNDCFKNLVDLEYLNLEDVRIENINTAMFQSLHNLESVDFISHYYCQYVPNQHNCRPNGDGISSSTNILSKPMFRYWNWIISSVICIGNFLVIFSRLLCKDDNPMLSLVIRNLAVSDFLMGVYLVIIGIKDVKYRNRYNEVVQEWKASWECTITGIVGMLSSEVTVCILVFISVDRFLMITSPLGKRSLQNKKHTMTILCIIWFLGILIAVAPVFRYANDDDRFYGVTGLCFPLHIGNTYFTGWQYSAVIIFGINATSLIIIAVVYVTMFVSIWKTRNATPLPRKEYDFVVRFFFIVFIYTICWLPIIILKATVFFSEISDEFYGWLIVFVLPINSASNPVLYTFTSPRFTARIRKSFAVENIVAKNNEYTSPAVSTEVKDDLDYGKNDANQVKIVVNKF
ncbi:unnamed protein product [Phaedon cochleariae]|uniref:G-protein coupled receptors family 1 profile domain-containing protein n=1 Tax=Phaedon cochleariae TaxID=80249 RepID=A0A9N9SBQ0_PHACE|nr:unnamed protein product [Phaedon cochleariae]